MQFRRMWIKMGLNKRERNLLIALGILVLLWGYYKFIISTQFESLNAKQEDKAHYEEELVKVQTIISSEREVDKKFAHIRDEIDGLSKKYFSKTDQSRFILLINELLEGTDLFVQNISFSPQRTEGIGDAIVEVMSITLPYEGNYSSLLSFLEKVRQHTPKTIIQNMDIRIKDKDMIHGSILLDFYSIPDLIEDDSIAYLFDSSEMNADPFYAFEDGSTDDGDLDGPIEEDLEYEGIDLSNITISFDSSRVLIEGFDNYALDFVASHPSIKGEIDGNRNAKQGTSSLGLHYNYPPIEQEKGVHAVFDGRAAMISKPPAGIGLWVYSYDGTKDSLKIRLKDRHGERHDVSLYNGIDWIGWKHLKINIPQEASLYPMEVERIIVEIDSTESGKGTLLLDALEAFYTIDFPNIEETTIGNFRLYDVQVGDSLSSISKAFYNDPSRQNDIKKYNGIKTNADLKPGRTIIIPMDTVNNRDDNNGPGQPIVIPN